jgi:hypothetical protein
MQRDNPGPGTNDAEFLDCCEVSTVRRSAALPAYGHLQGQAVTPAHSEGAACLIPMPVCLE